MNWIPLTSLQQLDQILDNSFQKPQVIFKHSTRCHTSSLALNRLERTEAPDFVDFNFLDLLAYREVSNSIADKLSVYHESPQIILIKDGVCTYDESHLGITMEEIIAEAQTAN